MYAEIDPDICLPEAVWGAKMRTHPWSHSTKNPEDRYYSFKRNPERIPEVMNEWKPWAHYEAVQQFYGLLKWLNTESPFETNDSRFYGVQSKEKEIWPHQLYCRGLMMFFFDKKRLNLSKQSKRWAEGTGSPVYLPPSPHIVLLQHTLYRNLLQVQPDFECGYVELSFFPTKYVRLKIPEQRKYGHELRLRFWAFGDTEPEVMDNLGLVFQGMEEALRLTAAEVRANHPAYAETSQ